LSNADKGAVGLIPALELASLTQVGVYLYTLASIYTTLDSQAHSTMATGL